MNMRQNPWEAKKTHRLGRFTVYSIEGRKSDPVRWYTELHIKGWYYMSFGSKAPTRSLAVLMTYLRAAWGKIND